MAVFSKLEEAITAFQLKSSLHCKSGCGKCCIKPDIEATILEFLPFAYAKYRAGQAFYWLERLREQNSPLCSILDLESTGVGLCSHYQHRGLICRLFGYSARRNKYGARELATCQVIKTEQSEAYKNTVNAIAEGMEVPVMSHYYTMLHGIDADLTREFYPINVAIRKALEIVLHYYAYRDEPLLDEPLAEA